MKYLQKTPKMCAAVAGILASIFPMGTPEAKNEVPDMEIVSVQSSSLLPMVSPTPQWVVDTIPVVVTAYSSTVWQTDDTPFITASGTLVRDGIVATNILPMGTKIKMPDIYGDKVFVVEDRMHPSKRMHIDVWFEEYSDALNFGAKHTTIEVLGS